LVALSADQETMTKRPLLIGIPVIVLLANGIGYLVVTRTRPAGPPPEAPRQQAVVPVPSSVGASAAGQDGAESADKKREESASAHRAAGLAALDAGDYDKALIQFTEARALLGDRAHVSELLRVTQDLRSRPPSQVRPRTIAASSTATASPGSSFRGAARALGGRRVVPVKEEPVATSSAGPGEAPSMASPSGLLIVTTTPRGLLVQIDDSAVDLTPMRTRVKPGSHRVILMDGDRKVYETTVDVREGATTPLFKDLGAPEPPVEAPRAVVTVPAASPPTGREETAPPTSPAAQEVAISRPAGLVAAKPAQLAPPPPETGVLSISSPGLYGVVWINGRARGYPPLEVRNVPTGQVKVEVRVNGVQKRASTVVVRPGATTAVKLTSEESVQ
jgi:hypothetical protein